MGRKEIAKMKEKKTYDMSQLQQLKMLTKGEAAFYMRTSERTLDTIARKKDFYPLIRIRRRVFINREKLDQWIDEQDGSYKM